MRTARRRAKEDGREFPTLQPSSGLPSSGTLERPTQRLRYSPRPTHSPETGVGKTSTWSHVQHARVRNVPVNTDGTSSNRCWHCARIRQKWVRSTRVEGEKKCRGAER